MSSRAIRALRGGIEPIPIGNDDSDEEDSEEEDAVVKTPAFALMDDDSDDDDNLSTSTSSSNHDRDTLPSSSVPNAEEAIADLKSESSSSEEDLDALLDEFKLNDTKLAPEEPSQGGALSPFHVILAGLEPTDLDIDFSTRNAYRGGGVASTTTASSRKKKGRQTFLFGPPREGWVKPPHFVGGGMGMDTYDRDTSRVRPWPYDSESEEVFSDKFWYTFKRSNTVKQDLEDYKVVQQMGDLNVLVMFIVHHPFVVDALLQLTSVLYQTNNTAEGLSLLRRCLWIHECSSLVNFARDVFDNTSSPCFMDMNQPENETYLRALAQLIRVSSRASLPKTALSVSRFVLALDPLRDPLGVLLGIDHYALACQSMNQWLVDLVDADCVKIWYRESENTSRSYSCSLTALPNFAYSYALALFRMHLESAEKDDDDCDGNSEMFREKADAALKCAICKFPAIVGMLLQVNEIDTTGRSMKRDWVSVLDWCEERGGTLRTQWLSSSNSDVPLLLVTSALQTCDTIATIFVNQSASFYKSEPVLQWMFDNIVILKRENPSVLDEFPPSPPICRYANVKPADYDIRVQLIPADANNNNNLIDPNALAHAMVIQTHHPRLLRQYQQQQQGNRERAAAQQLFMGPPHQQVDPDWPLAEVFWRSLLPWNEVEGVPAGIPPPPRNPDRPAEE